MLVEGTFQSSITDKQAALMTIASKKTGLVIPLED
jgi:hypothetical protein